MSTELEHAGDGARRASRVAGPIEAAPEGNGPSEMTKAPPERGLTGIYQSIFVGTTGLEPGTSTVSW